MQKKITSEIVFKGYKRHVRRALEQRATEQRTEQAILLAFNTCGFPRMVLAWQWAGQQIERGGK